MVAGFAASSKYEIARVLKESGVKGGFVVHLGASDGSATAALRPSDSFQVQALVPNKSLLDKVRNEIRKALGEYGPVAADFVTASNLPYVDNMVCIKHFGTVLLAI